MKSLNLYETYSRKDVYEVFDGITRFTSGSGTWGIHGIVKIPNRKKDYVLFVTFGQKDFGMEFQESVTIDGILTWQSQPKQGFQNSQIQDLITHDYLKHNVYFFLRTKKMSTETKKGEPFTYMGKLAYVAHDNRKECPVHIMWQIVNWKIPKKAILNRMGLELSSELGIDDDGNRVNLRESLSDLKKRKLKKIDYVAQNQKNNEVGLKGELFVFNYLKHSLLKAKQMKLAEKMIHTSVVEGDGAGYDILAFDNEGGPLHIEVKTTTGGKNSRFFISSNELAFSKENSLTYRLYRVYNFDTENNQGEIEIYRNNLFAEANLEPTSYQVKINEQKSIK